jgi:putative hydrolase of the HAD superfamily
MNLKSKIRHIFFDLDRTLWDYDANLKESLEELYDEHLRQKVQGDSEAFCRIFHFENTRLWSDFTANKIDKAYLRDNRFYLTLQRMGLDDRHLAHHLEENYITQTPAKTRLIKGTHECLSHLAQNYKLHIITNGFEDAQQFKLSNSGIRHYFKEVITSDTAQSTKPNIDIFRHSETRSGAHAGECLMIGDDWRVDVEGALAAGWEALHFNPQGDREMERNITCLSELHEIL